MITLCRVKGIAVILRPSPEEHAPRVRKHLSADALYSVLRCGFDKIPDQRERKCPISLTDALMSAVGMFSLKDPSLLAFEERRNDENMRNLFGIARVPSDTHMREILDRVEPRRLRPSFNAVFRRLQRGKVLEPFVFYKGCYLLSLDGTGYFSSSAIHCDSCLEKVNKQTGEITYQHQMLAAVMVHPSHREVIPLAPEPIEKQDGSEKNDCERNAAKRLLRQIRQEHPHLKLIVVEDGLASNAPHIRELQALNMHFILGAKPGDHPFLLDQVLAAFDADQVTTGGGPRFLYQRTGRICKGLERLSALHFFPSPPPRGGGENLPKLRRLPTSRHRSNSTFWITMLSADCPSHAWCSASCV